MALRPGLVLTILALPALAQEGPVLGVASNFEQGNFPEKMAASRQLPVLDFRDAMRWREVEQAAGVFVFGQPTTTYPDRLAELGAVMSLTIDGTNPLYDGGFTPSTPEGRAAFARYAARAVQRFSNIHSLEVGNEFNTSSFTHGPGWEGDIRERARSYAALVRATSRAVRAVRPEVKILGGAAHSIPLPWFEEIFAQGGAADMDAMVLHPYDTPPEMLKRQIALLRRIPGAEGLPIEITEWGHPSEAEAPSHLLKGYCQFALAGVTRFIWYPLGDRGDGMVPLMEGESITPAGRAYQIAQTYFAGMPVTDLATDPFTYGCAFGDRAMLLWGAPREIELAEGISAIAPDGTPLEATRLRLDRDMPVVLISGQAIRLGEEVRLGPHGVIADSFDQFSFPVVGQPRGSFALFSEDGGLLPYEIQPGQQRDGVPWSPYLASPLHWQLRADADWVMPRYVGSFVMKRPVSVVLRYRADRDGPALLRIEIEPSGQSTDGVVLGVRMRGELILEQPVTGAEVVEQEVALARGQDLDVIVGPGGEDEGDFTRLRVRLEELE